MLNRICSSNLVVRSIAATALLASGFGASGQCFMTRLTHADRQAGDLLGQSLSMSDVAGGGTSPMCAVGMQGDGTPAGAAAGSVRFFGLTGFNWGEVPGLTIMADDAQPNDYFGASVSYRDPYCVVGAIGAGTTGAAYIYRRNGNSWVKEAKVIPPGSASGDDCGRAVAVNGEWMVVGSPWASFDGSPAPGWSDPVSGMATIYRRQANGTWTYHQTLRDANAGITAGQAAHARYGSALDMKGFIMVVGVPYGQNVGGPAYHGYIRILRINLQTNPPSWLDDGTGRYTSPLVQELDRYGAAVSTSGDAIAIGAPDDDAMPGEVSGGNLAKQDSGAVYFLRYTVNGWVDDGRVIPPDAVDNGHFGGTVSMGWGGQRCLISAYGAKKAYLYRRVSAGQWVLEATFQDPDSSGASAFASGLAYDGTHAMIGDWGDSTGGAANGGAVFAVTPSQGYGDTCADAVPAQVGFNSGCTTFAQAEGTSTCGGGGAGYGPDVWYSYTPMCTGPVTLWLGESGFDTVVSVHSACPDAAGSNTIACDDDSGPGLTSQLTFTASAGTSYLIRIAGFSGATGSFHMDLGYPEPANDWCTSPTPVTTGTYTFINCSASTDGPSGVGGNSCNDHLANDVWYSFSSPAAGTLHLDTCGSNFDTMIAVYTGATCPGGIFATPIACNDDVPNGGACDHATSALSIGTLNSLPYMIRIGGFDQIDPTGDGVLNVRFVPDCRCDWNASGGLSVQDIFDYLASYFAGGGEFNTSGATTVQDLFDFLACYFGGC